MTDTVRYIDTNTETWGDWHAQFPGCLVFTSPSPRDLST